MSVVESVYVDVRWREPGWLEVFRLRLAGWLPIKDAALGEKLGVTSTTVDGRWIFLTKRGLDLTQPADHSFTEDNIKLLCSVLELNDFNNSWVQPPEQDQGAFLRHDELFENDYSNAILAPLGTSRSLGRIWAI